VIDNVGAPVARGFVNAIKGIIATLKVDAIKVPQERKSIIKNLEWESYWRLSGHMRPACEVVWQMFGEAADLVSFLFAAGGFSLNSFRYMISDAFRELTLRLAFTFNRICEEEPNTHPFKHLATVIRRYLNDAFIYVKVLLTRGIKFILQSPLDQYLIQPAQLLVTPVQDMINAAGEAVPGLSELFSVADLLAMVVNKTVDGAVDVSLAGLDLLTKPILAEVESEIQALN
jgi:hypothetical protein